MKKCIVLDLDNTLWGGVIGEDGFDGIQLSVGGDGAPFIAFQQVLLDLYNRGVILAINSANNHNDAMQVIEKHPNMILKPNHFAAYRMNWIDKTENIRELAQELNIGLDSMVFLDDNPTNRAAMRTFVPEVETPELPADPKDYAKFLLSLPYFATFATTDEDAMRGNMYVTERLRRESEKDFTDKTEFLKTLGLELTLKKNDVSAIARLSQLSGKTNQFNSKKQPFTEKELQKYMEDSKYEVFHARTTDRFGDYGITAFALAQKNQETWYVESLLMSCRVLGRGVEKAFLSAIASVASKEGAKTFTIAFEPTEKNMPVKEFLDDIVTDNHVETARLKTPEWVTIHYEDI